MYSRLRVQRKAAAASQQHRRLFRPFADETQPGTHTPPISESLPTYGFDLSQISIFPPQPNAVQTKQAVGLLIQRDDSSKVAAAKKPTYRVGWTDAASSEAKSGVTQAPQNTGWNAGEFKVGKIRRIPIQGLKQGNQESAMFNRDGKTAVASQESAAGRAIVLIPENLVQQINAAQPIELLLHFHGHNIADNPLTDYRQQQGKGTVYDVEYAKIEQQLEASNRPMIAVLPEGTSRSQFGEFNSDAYLQEVYDALVQANILQQKPNVQRVALSGHSGGGDAAGRLFNSKNAPTKMSDLILFDGIHDGGAAAIVWVENRLKQDLAYLTSGISEAKQLHYLEGSSRFRGYYTTGYAKRYKNLGEAIDTWFENHANHLGGSSSTVYQKLHDNYRTIPVGHSNHFTVMSDAVKKQAGKKQAGDKGAHWSPLLDALNALPPTATSAPAGSASTSIPPVPTIAPPSTDQHTTQLPPPQPESSKRTDQHPAISAATKHAEALGGSLGATIAALITIAPQLVLQLLTQIVGGQHGLETITDDKALIRTSPPELQSTGQILPQGSQVEVLQITVENGKEYALVQQVVPNGVGRSHPLRGWTRKSNLGQTSASEKKPPAIATHETKPVVATEQPTQTPTEFKKVKFGRSLPQVDGVLTLADKNPEDWFSNFTNLTFLGRPLKTPIHTSLAAHLQAVEAKFAAKYGSAEAAGKQFGLTEHIAGSREKSKTAAYSMHIFGLAIDLDPGKNPYIANGNKTMASSNTVFHRVGMLLLNQPLKFDKVYGTKDADIQKAYTQNQIIDAALEEYFSYSQASAETDQKLAELLQKATNPEWQGKTLEEARAIIKKDIQTCAALWSRKGQEEQISKHGMMSLKEELVIGMGLDWGGRYGDFMHFDMRNRGTGEEIYNAIGKYKKQLEKEKKAAK
ncbi:MAG: M15 family metallopeptidase [Scytolyngbya sp. HA4215-MV1]|jgi:hypothetical protein|nr:M15 family metallopeptidase [Scytolyngbya sp. HA4215-MV1]